MKTGKEINGKQCIRIEGNTHPVKDRLKKLDAIWVPSENAWYVPEKWAERAQQIVNEVTAKI